MYKQYEQPEMKIVKLETEDVIMTSIGGRIGGDDGPGGCCPGGCGHHHGDCDCWW